MVSRVQRSRLFRLSMHHRRRRPPPLLCINPSELLSLLLLLQEHGPWLRFPLTLRTLAQCP